jgi:dTDP-glucose pyrophosphorylase
MTKQRAGYRDCGIRKPGCRDRFYLSRRAKRVSHTICTTEEFLDGGFVMYLGDNILRSVGE